MNQLSISPILKRFIRTYSDGNYKKNRCCDNVILTSIMIRHASTSKL